MTFEGRRAGEGYFSADGKRVVFINNQEGDYDIWKIDLTEEEPKFKETEVEELFKLTADSE